MRHPTRPQTRRVLLLAAIVLALVAVVALPVPASANSTSLTLVASPAITPSGGIAVLTGTLMDTSGAPVALGGQAVYVLVLADRHLPRRPACHHHDGQRDPGLRHRDVHFHRHAGEQDLLPDDLPWQRHLRRQ